RLRLLQGENSLEVRLEGGNASIGGRRVAFGVSRAAGRLEAIRVGDKSFPVRVAREGDRVLVWCAGRTLEFRNAGARRARRREASGGLAAPMPGRVRKVLAGAGQKVEPGDVV